MMIFSTVGWKKKKKKVGVLLQECYAEGDASNPCYVYLKTKQDRNPWTSFLLLLLSIMWSHIERWKVNMAWVNFFKTVYGSRLDFSQWMEN